MRRRSSPSGRQAATHRLAVRCDLFAQSIDWEVYWKENISDQGDVTLARRLHHHAEVRRDKPPISSFYHGTLCLTLDTDQAVP